MLKRFSAAKKTVQSKSVPKMAVFRKFKGLHIVVIGTPQRHILGRNDVFWRIFRKIPFRGVGCSELQEPKKALKNHPMQMVRKITCMGIKKP